MPSNGFYCRNSFLSHLTVFRFSLLWNIYIYVIRKHYHLAKPTRGIFIATLFCMWQHFYSYRLNVGFFGRELLSNLTYYTFTFAIQIQLKLYLKVWGIIELGWGSIFWYMVHLSLLCVYKCTSFTILNYLHIFMQMLKCIFVLFTGPEEVLKFQGNDTVVDHFKLVLRDGNSLLVGARYLNTHKSI